MKETKREILAPISSYLYEHAATAKLIFDTTYYQTKNYEAAQLEYLLYINQRYRQLQAIIDSQL